MNALQKSRTLLKASNIVKRFGDLTALNNFSIEVFDGEIVGLLGPNGAGKSTFINIVCGLLEPDSGEIFYKDVNILGLRPHEIARRGIVKTYQIPKVFSNISVLNNVLAAISWLQQPVGKAQEIAYESLKLVKLHHKAEQLASELSGGERKLLEFARAMALKPKLLLADEPFAGVNPVLKDVLIKALRNVNSKGVTVLCVSHDMSEIRKLCNRVVFLAAGSKLVEGYPEEVLKNREVIRLYLGGRAVAEG